MAKVKYRRITEEERQTQMALDEERRRGPEGQLQGEPDQLNLEHERQVEEFQELDRERAQLEADRQAQDRERDEEILSGLKSDAEKGLQPGATDAQKAADPDDPIRYYDKGMLRAFADSVRDRLYPGQALKELPESEEDRKAFLEELSREDNDTVEDHEADLLRAVLDDIHIYTSLDRTGNINARKKTTEEILLEDHLAARITRRLNLLYDRILEDRAKDNEEGFNDMEFRRRVGSPENGEKMTISSDFVPEETPEQKRKDEQEFAVANLLNYFDAETGGQLGMDPLQQEEEDAVHITYTGKYLGNAVYDYMHAQLEQDQNKGNSPVEGERRKRVLFPHVPSHQDVNQGPIGDCHLVATLSEIALKRPQRLKEMMRDNGNGTVTVRLFQKLPTPQNQPPKFRQVFVTVDKVKTFSQSRGSEWVSTLERAIAASGLMRSQHMNDMDDAEELPRPVPDNIDEIYQMHVEQRTQPDSSDYPWLFRGGQFTKWEPDLQDLSGGNAIKDISILLGPDAESEKIETGSSREDAPGVGINTVHAIRLNSYYTDREMRIWTKLQEACGQDSLIEASTFAPGNGEGDKMTIAGLNKQHEYTVLGIETVEIEHEGKKYSRHFVKIRNPHGNYGRTYLQDGGNIKAIANDDPSLGKSVNKTDNGVGYVELKDFVKEFQDVTITKVAKSQAEKEQHRMQEQAKLLRSYRKAFGEIARNLQAGDKGMTKNSNEYKMLMDDLSDMLSHFPDTYQKLKARSTFLRKDIQQYLEHTRRIPQKADNVRRTQKLEACNAMLELLEDMKTLEDPMEKRRIQAAEQIIDAYVKAGEKAEDAPEKMTRTLEKIRTDRPKVRSQILKSREFQAWAENKSFLSLREAVMKGVDPADIPLSLKKEEDLPKREMTTLQEAGRLAVQHINPDERKDADKRIQQAKDKAMDKAKEGPKQPKKQPKKGEKKYREIRF